MNNASGSVLQKVTFILVLLIAAAAGYLLVRERLRADQQSADAAAAVTAKTAPLAAAAPDRPAPPPEKPNYAPLRPRVETNVVRVLTNRPVSSPGTGDRLIVLTSSNAAETSVPIPVVGAARADGAFAGITGGGAAGRTAASVTGRVLLRGTPPPEKVIALDPACGRLNTVPLTTRFYVAGEGGALADVFVYVKAGAPATGPPAGRGPLLDQSGCEYQPYIFGVQTGQTLNVRNSDSILHNVHSLTKNPGNRERNVAQPVKGMTTAFVFATPEVFVQFKCEVHPWMFAYVGVVAHPWFAVTDRNGNFALPAGLPPGQYTLAAIHRKAGELLQQINVSEDGAAPVTFTLDVPDGLAKTNTP